MEEGKNITMYNLSKLLRKLDLNSLNPNDNIYHKNFKWFNIYERRILLAYIMLLEEPEKILIYDKQKPFDSGRFIYETHNLPSYHYDKDCTKLNSDFMDYLIPEEIKKQGIIKINEFRDFFKQNFSKMAEDVFLERLRIKFGLAKLPELVHYENSGVGNKQNLDLEELKTTIDDIITDAYNYYKSNPRINTILNAFGLDSERIVYNMPELYYKNPDRKIKIIDMESYVHMAEIINRKSDKKPIVKIDLSTNQNQIISTHINPDFLLGKFYLTPESIESKPVIVTLMERIEYKTEYYCKISNAFKKHQTSGYDILYIELLEGTEAKNVENNRMMGIFGQTNKNKFDSFDFTNQEILETVTHFHQLFKEPVKRLLIEYLRLKYNPELKFRGDLLEQLGFKKCQTCH